MEVYPDFVKRRVAQVHDDYDYAVRSQMVDMYGVNTFDDLHFMFLRDQGKISGPQLSRRQNKNDMYTAGWLSPWQFYKERDTRGVRMPFAAANIGPKAANDGDWYESDAGQPLGGGRDLNSLARHVMAPAKSVGSSAASRTPTAKESGPYAAAAA